MRLRKHLTIDFNGNRIYWFHGTQQKPVIFLQGVMACTHSTQDGEQHNYTGIGAGIGTGNGTGNYWLAYTFSHSRYCFSSRSSAVYVGHYGALIVLWNETSTFPWIRGRLTTTSPSMKTSPARWSKLMYTTGKVSAKMEVGIIKLI